MDELSLGLARLGRVLGRARAGEHRQVADEVRDGGEALAHLLVAVLKLGRVHSADNRAFDAPVAELSRVLSRLVQLLGPVAVAAVEDQVYVNEVRIRSKDGSAKDLAAELARHNAGGATFHLGLSEDEVRAFTRLFAQKPTDAAPRRALQRALLDASVRSVELAPRLRFRAQSDEGESYHLPREALRRGLRLVEEAYDSLSSGRVLNPLPLRRVVAEMVEIGPEEPSLWETLGEGLPHATHAATVSLVALLVGKAAGLRKSLLHDLGLAGLVHDAGYAALGREAGGPEGLARHPGEGARILLRQRGFHEAKLRRLRAVLDHHRDHVEPRGRPSVLGETLRLAEDYATLLRVHSGRITPCDALGAIARAAGRIYHPVLAQVMVNVLGRYPPGTLLELTDGRWARSVSPVRSPETYATPLIRVYDLHTRALSPDRLDLAEGGSVARAVPG